MKKISLIGVSIIGNRGAEAMLTTVIGRLREHYGDAVFNVYSIYPKTDRKLVDDPNIRIFSSKPLFLLFLMFPLSLILGFFLLLRMKFMKKIFPKSIVNLAESDILIDLAGVSFIDSRIKFLPFNILTIFPAFLFGVPVLKYAQAVGPFNKLLNRWSANLFLKPCKRVFARGEKTLEHLRQINFDKNRAVLTTDVAFLQNQGDSLSVENRDYLSEMVSKLDAVKNQGVIVGICPSSVVYKASLKTGWDYTGFLRKVIKHLVDSNHKILLFPNATREHHPDKLRNNDLPVIAEIMNLFENEDPVYKEHIIYINKDLNTDGLKALISKIDIALVSRFHAMIACLTLKKPLMVIGWSHKYAEVMKLFDMEGLVYDYKSKNESELFDKILQLSNERDILKTKVEKKIGQVKELAKIQIDQTVAFLEKTSNTKLS